MSSYIEGGTEKSSPLPKTGAAPTVDFQSIADGPPVRTCSFYALQNQIVFFFWFSRYILTLKKTKKKDLPCCDCWLSVELTCSVITNLFIIYKDNWLCWPSRSSETLWLRHAWLNLLIGLAPPVRGHRLHTAVITTFRFLLPSIIEDDVHPTEDGSLCYTCLRADVSPSR